MSHGWQVLLNTAYLDRPGNTEHWVIHDTVGGGSGGLAHDLYGPLCRHMTDVTPGAPQDATAEITKRARQAMEREFFRLASPTSAAAVWCAR
ncbi:hypothetical protein GA0074695_0143 [Micromonospora viridifaciens]|uniref:Uncharacterized protein n=1 Tax=Micromonospora viridifaciens TaxID=1881 RepID=A0A1C4U4B3_MICVI|nr:hypothetical protein GA0074695_0143 [Micromonospora viridifaciens]